MQKVRNNTHGYSLDFHVCAAAYVPSHEHISIHIRKHYTRKWISEGVLGRVRAPTLSRETVWWAFFFFRIVFLGLNSRRNSILSPSHLFLVYTLQIYDVRLNCCLNKTSFKSKQCLPKGLKLFHKASNCFVISCPKMFPALSGRIHNSEK